MLKHLPLVITNLAIVWVAANSPNFATKAVEQGFGPIPTTVAKAPVVAPAAVVTPAPVAAPSVIEIKPNGYLARLRDALNKGREGAAPAAPAAPVHVAQTPISLPAGPNLSNLPKFIQTLDTNEYAAWVVWQNEQTKIRAASGCSDSMWNYGLETTVDSTGSSSASGYSRGRSCRSGNVTSKRGIAGASSHRNSSTTARTWSFKYLNSDYDAPDSIMIYNPWVRAEVKGAGPDWATLFVPCPDGITRTLAESLTLAGPVDPEILYAELLSPYFSRVK